MYIWLTFIQIRFWFLRVPVIGQASRECIRTRGNSHVDTQNELHSVAAGENGKNIGSSTKSHKLIVHLINFVTKTQNTTNFKINFIIYLWCDAMLIARRYISHFIHVWMQFLHILMDWTDVRFQLTKLWSFKNITGNHFLKSFSCNKVWKTTKNLKLSLSL